ncbi:MAG: TIGR04086 family membrane protein [Clostridia bacterium]|nr:TIGR04086 family membrane protein [Clostridia bacterium]
MKKAFSHAKRPPLYLILRGVAVSVIATVILVVLFALLLSLFDLSDGVVHTVNQIIKIVSVGAGVFASVFPGSERGLLRGAAVGLIYMTAGVALYAVLTGQHLSLSAYLADILMGAAAGGLIGLLRAKAV